MNQGWGETPSSPDLQWIEIGLDGVSPHRLWLMSSSKRNRSLLMSRLGSVLI